MENNIYNLTEKSKLQQATVEYFISFVVVFENINALDFLRIFSNNQLIDEVVCDAKIKIIRVPIRFQRNIQFEMFGSQNNQCKFFFVGLSRKGDNHFRGGHEKYARTTRLLFLFKSDWSEHYCTAGGSGMLGFNAGTMFGHHLYGKIARPDQTRLQFSADLQTKDAPHNAKNWVDATTGKNYTLFGETDYIAKFRTGYACLYIKNTKYISLH